MLKLSLLFQMDQFVEDEIQAAFVPDGLASSHPIYVPVKRVEDIWQIYDLISYKKVTNCLNCLLNFAGGNTSPTSCFLFQGAAIIRMMDSFLGRDTFQRGLTVSNF